MKEAEKHRDAVVRIIQHNTIDPDARDSILFHFDQAIMATDTEAEGRGHDQCKDQTIHYLNSQIVGGKGK